MERKLDGPIEQKNANRTIEMGDILLSTLGLVSNFIELVNAVISPIKEPVWYARPQIQTS